tara:strand:- start:257 stop:427 length:171 start_codon:yes stop_codon:yes gene_type:complete
MASKKLKKKINSKIAESTGKENTTPKTAKIVLFLFGVGPLLIMFLFLFLKGFFNSL